MRLIDADEVIKAVNELMIVDKTVMNFVLMNAPTVDAVPVRHGRWEYKKCGFYKVCSECMTEFENDGCFEYFCPNCGAKMDCGHDG